jgi:hypothetical protein
MVSFEKLNETAQIKFWIGLRNSFFAYGFILLGFGWWGYWDVIPRFIKPEKIIKK